MTDVFISYTPEDRAWVKEFAAALNAAGLAVLWDLNPQLGQSTAHDLEGELAAARAVVAVWSNQARNSSWVRDVAQEAFDRGVLLPVLMDIDKPPLGFRQVRCADLRGWSGDPNFPALVELIGQLRERVAPLPVEPSSGEPDVQDFERSTIVFRDPAAEAAAEVPSIGISQSLATSAQVSISAKTAAVSRKGVGPANLNPGDEVGNYRVIRRLGAGGFGAVYEACNIHNEDERVALKLLLAAIAESETFAHLLRLEANALLRLKHPAVVQYRVFGRIADSDQFYLVTEYVPGPTLREWRKANTPTLSDIRTLAIRLAQGLSAAHRRGIVHRDLAPDNVIVMQGELAESTLIDFGIARLAENDTLSGAFAGKFSYAAPEQLEFDPTKLGPAIDIYSFGLLIASFARGRPLDMGRNIEQAREKRRGVPPLDDVPVELREILTRLLQPEASDRPAGMEAVSLLFERLGEVAPEPAIAPPAAAPAPPPEIAPPPPITTREVTAAVALKPVDVGVPISDAKPLPTAELAPKKPPAEPIVRAPPRPAEPRKSSLLSSLLIFLVVALVGGGATFMFWPHEDVPVAGPAIPVPETPIPQPPQPQPPQPQPQPQPQPDKPPEPKLASGRIEPVPAGTNAQASSGTVFGKDNADARIVYVARRETGFRLDGAGQPAVEARLKQGDSYRLPNRADLRVSVDDAGALDVLLDGKFIGRAGPDGARLSEFNVTPVAYGGPAELPKPPLPEAPLASGKIEPPPSGTAVQKVTGTVYGQENADARIVYIIRRDTDLKVVAGGKIAIERVLKIGDAYRLPDQLDVKISTKDAGALDVVLDGAFIGRAGPDGARLVEFAATPVAYGGPAKLPPPPVPLAPLASGKIEPAPAGAAVQVASGTVYGKDNEDARIVYVARRESDLKVLGGSKVLIERTLKVGDSYRVPNRTDIKVSAKDAGALDVVLDGTFIGRAGPDGAQLVEFAVTPVAYGGPAELPKPPEAPMASGALEPADGAKATKASGKIYGKANADARIVYVARRGVDVAVDGNSSTLKKGDSYLWPIGGKAKLSASDAGALDVVLDGKFVGRAGPDGSRLVDFVPTPVGYGGPAELPKPPEIPPVTPPETPPVTPPETPPTTPPVATSGDAVATVNAIRQAAGARAVQNNASLNAVAASLAQYNAQRGVAGGVDANQVLKMLIDNGYGNARAGQAHARNQKSAGDAVKFWQGRADTGPMITDPNMAAMGFAVATAADGKLYYTMVIAYPPQ